MSSVPGGCAPPPEPLPPLVERLLALLAKLEGFDLWLIERVINMIRGHEPWDFNAHGLLRTVAERRVLTFSEIKTLHEAADLVKLASTNP